MNVETVCTASSLPAVQTSHFLSSAEVTPPGSAGGIVIPPQLLCRHLPRVFWGLTGLICQPFQTAVRWTPQGLRRQRRRSRTDARSWERGALTALQRPRNEQSPLTSEGCPDPATADLTLQRRGPVVSEYLQKEERLVQIVSPSPAEKGVTGTKCLAMRPEPRRLIKPFRFVIVQFSSVQLLRLFETP